jgi:hypothetical protein
MSTRGGTRGGARVAASILTLGLLALCGCSLLLNVDGLDVPDPAIAVEGGRLDGAGDARDGSTDIDSPDGSQGDSRGDGQSGWDADRPTDSQADSQGDGRTVGAPEAGDDAGDGGDARVVDGGASDAADGGPVDGAGADASDASDGGAVTVGPDGCALVTHTNGVGQTWQDCAALGTHNRTEAQSACDALTTTANCTAGTGCNLSYTGVSVAGSGGAMTTYLWIYGTSNMSMYNPGDVLAYPSGGVQCNNLPRSTATWR